MNAVEGRLVTAEPTVTQLAGHLPPDVFTDLWPSESGIPADPLISPLSSVFAEPRGWRSNRTPNLIPRMTPRRNPQRK